MTLGLELHLRISAPNSKPPVLSKLILIMNQQKKQSHVVNFWASLLLFESCLKVAKVGQGGNFHIPFLKTSETPPELHCEN